MCEESENECLQRAGAPLLSACQGGDQRPVSLFSGPRGKVGLQLVTRFGWAGARPAGRQPQGSAAALAAAHVPLLQDGGNMPPVPLSAKFKIFDWLVFCVSFPTV